MMNYKKTNRSKLISIWQHQRACRPNCKPIDLLSPNGEIKVSITPGDKINYTISGNGQDLLTKDHLALILRDGKINRG